MEKKYNCEDFADMETIHKYVEDMENYEEKYNAALERAKYALTTDMDNSGYWAVNYIFPELKVSNGERMLREIKRYIKEQGDKPTGLPNGTAPVSDMIAWLEKQGESNGQTVLTLPKFTFNDVLALQCCMETVKKVQEDKELYEKLNDLHSKVYDSYQLEKQDEQSVEPKWCHHNVDLSNCSEEYRKAYYDGWTNCIFQHSQWKAESDDKDERIRKQLLNWFKGCHWDAIDDETLKRDDIIAWFEKQESVGEIVERCKISWYNEGKIDGRVEGLSDDEKYQQGWHDALEKQGKKLTDKIEPKLKACDFS